jgi:hypothetical protein
LPAPRQTRLAFLVAGLACAAAPVALADGISLGPNDPAYLELGAGGYDVLHNNTAGIFRAEYRFQPKLWVLTPLVGGEVTTDGSLYGYGGFALDVHLGSQWLASWDETVGAWSRGNGKQLGSAIEFRSGGEIDYVLADESRIGVSFHHISNAGIGRHNPGEEEALALYSIPFGR